VFNNNNNNLLHINVPPSVERRALVSRVSSIASSVACLNANLNNLKLNKKHTLLQVFQPDTDCVAFSSPHCWHRTIYAQGINILIDVKCDNLSK